MAQQALKLKHVFGHRADVPGNLHFTDESSVIFTAGHNLLLHNLDDQTQIFCHGLNTHTESEPKSTISAIDVSASRRYCAVAERTENGPRITVITCTSERLRRKRRLDKLQLEGDVVSVKFSPDERSLLVLMGAPDHTLFNIAWEKQRITQSMKHLCRGKTNLYGASFCPMEPTLVAVIGRPVVRFLRIDGNDFRSVQTNLSKKENHEFMCYSWDNEKRLLVGTFGAEVLIFEGNDYKGSFDIGIASPVLSIACTMKGFVCGCDQGVLMCFERGDNPFYTHIKKLSFLNPFNVSHIALSPTEEYLIACLEGGQPYMINLSHLELINDAMALNPIFAPVHSNSIYGLDISVRKPWIASCGSDKYVRIYNWMNNSLVLEKKYRIYALSVSIHPSGSFLVVGFQDKLRLLNIHIDDFVEYRDYPMKNCKYIRFSNGGQYFAAVNAGSVQIFNTFECKNIANLRGHTGKINSISWSADDSRITTASSDSTVLEWDLATGTRIQDLTSKGCIYTSAASTEKSEMLCVGNDAKLKLVEEGKQIRNVALDSIATKIELCPSESTVIVGLKNGDLQMFELPLKDNNQRPLSSCGGGHSSTVTCIRVSDDGSVLVSSSEDGSICVYESREPKPASSKRGKESALAFAEEILVERYRLQHSRDELHKLEKEVEKTRKRGEKELGRKKEMNQKEVGMKRKQYHNRIDTESNLFDNLELDKKQKAEKYEHMMVELQQREEANDAELNQYYEKKLQGERMRFTDLQSKHKGAQVKQVKDDKLRDQIYAKEISIMKRDFEEKISSMKDAGVDHENDFSRISKEFDIVKDMLEHNAEEDIEKIKAEYDEILKEEKGVTLNLKGNNGMLKREFAGLKQKITSGNDKLQKRNVQLGKLDEEAKRLDKDIEGYEREIKERENTIQEKDRMINDLRKKNQELEKFKFVLEYKINELDRQIQPRDQTIEEIHGQLAEMREEVGEYTTDNQQFTLELTDINLKLTASLQEEEKQKEVLRDILGVKLEYCSGLHEAKQNIDNSQKLKGIVRKLYQTYGSMQEIREPQVKEEKHINRGNTCEVFRRRRDFLKKKAESIESQMELAKTKHVKKQRRYLKENALLLEQLNELRMRVVESKSL